MTNKQNLITEVKEALMSATPDWHYNGNEIVSTIDPKCGIGGFLEEDDNILAVNSRKWLQQIVTELEEAHKKQKGMISKDKLLEWLKIEIELSQGSNSILKHDSWAFQQVRQAIRQGTFDVKEGL